MNWNVILWSSWLLDRYRDCAVSDCLYSNTLPCHGRDEDHLQGISRTAYNFLEEVGKDIQWVSYDHDFHGYVFPVCCKDGGYELNEVQVGAIDDEVTSLKTRLI
ncbi:MAG: hypothetical protein ACI9O0_000123 [Paracoccaceae bacterium]